MYPLSELYTRPVPAIVTETEFNRSIAHDIERNRWGYLQHWTGAREMTGDIMEHSFRLLFSIPVHLPRPVMKTIFLFLTDEDADLLWGYVGAWVTPDIVPFKWPKPFRRP